MVDKNIPPMSSEADLTRAVEIAMEKPHYLCYMGPLCRIGQVRPNTAQDAEKVL